MTQKEFEELTGTTITTEEFAWADTIYMLTDTIQKAEFCRLYKKLNLALLVRGLVKMDEDEKEVLRQRDEAQNRAIELQRRLDSLKDAIKTFKKKHKWKKKEHPERRYSDRSRCSARNAD